MGGRLYGQQALQEGFVPRLVGLHHKDGYLVPFAYPKGAPVVRVVGGRGSGKTALLGAVHDAYNGRVPLARVDLGAPGFGEPGVADGDDDVPNASRITHLLYLLAYKLGLEVRHFGRPMTFPRLSLGLLVVTAWRPLNSGETDVRPPDLRRAEADLRTLITAEDPDVRRRRESLGRWFDLVTDNLPLVLSAVPGLDTIAGIVLDSARTQLLKNEPDKGALAWWGDRLHSSQGYQGDSLQRLFQFVRGFRRLDDRRRTAEEHLVAALLDDIDANYGTLRRLNRKPRPVLLLDNAHTDVGRVFLDLLDAGHGDASGRARTRPAAIATLLGRRRGYPPLSEVGGDAVPRDRPLVLSVPDIEPAHIAEMLSPVDYPDHLPRVVARYSGGRAASARTLADAAVRRVEDVGTIRGGELLDEAAPALLAKLLPDPVMRERLVLLSAAADAGTRRGLWTFAHPEDHSEEMVAVRVREADDYRTRSCLDGDRALDLLLRHRLASTLTHERWRDTQLRLRSLCDPRGDTYLHHTLALGRVEEVVSVLHHRFTVTPPAAWLTSLNRICAAPHPREGYEPPAGSPTLSCTACGSDAPGPHHDAVASLVPLLWRLSDPLTLAPREDELTTVRIALETLYGNKAAHAAYREASAAWPVRLRAGAQAPDLPVQEGAAS
ncbi:hypothetical protein AB0D99_03405 [Streptomyces sp. NPDC047971]|uniref:hypothetical protein n=1 Tax=Streptomyces sp. NPDC047971 TaxID=3154499 RepID=UPI0033D9C050